MPPYSAIPLLVLGDFAWDVLIRTNSELLPGGDTFGEVMLAPGGTAANVAVWAARCGLNTGFVGKVGRDRFGQLAAENLRQERVEAHLIQTEEHRTAAVAVWIDHQGERSMVSGQGADFYLLPSELPRKRLQQARHLHLSGWSFFTDPPRSAARTAAELARQNGATLSFDPGSFQMIERLGVDKFLSCTRELGVNILFPNHEEGRLLSGEEQPEAIAKRLAELYPGALIALKLDAEGALVYDGQHSSHIPPGPESLVDATGAGDSFAGAYLSRWLTGHSPVQAATFAVQVSSWVIRRIGARPATDSQLLALLS